MLRRLLPQRAIGGPPEAARISCVDEAGLFFDRRHLLKGMARGVEMGSTLDTGQRDGGNEMGSTLDT